MGSHGVTAQEREKDQEFLVDVECELDLAAAGRADRIEHTVDYMELIDDVRQVVNRESYNLLEALADRLAQAILRRPFIDRVSIGISKSALVTKEIDAVGIRIERGKQQGGLQDEELSPR